MKRALNVVVALHILVSCDSPGNPRPGPEDVTVELDAFSGRPNPVWRLSAQESGELAARLIDLSRANATRLPDAGLGYRGFRISNPDGEGGIPEGVYISSAGLLQITQGGDSSAILEDRHDVEAFLTEVATSRGYGNLR